MRRPSSAGKRDHLLGDRRRRRPAGRAGASPRPSRSRRAGSARSSSTCAPQVELLLGDDDRAARRRSKKRAFFAWWSAVACGYGTSRAGLPAAATSQTEPPARATTRSAAASAAPKSSVNGSRTYPARETRRAQRLVVRLAAEVQDGRALLGEGRERGLVQRARALAPAEDEHDRPRPPAARSAPEPRPAPPAAPRGDGPPDDAVLLPVSPLDREGEEDAARERRGEAVGEAEVRVGLHAARPGSARARPRASSARRRSRRRRARRRAGGAAGSAGRRARPRPPAPSARASGEPGPARDPVDREAVELEPRGGDERGLSSLRAGERDAHAAAPRAPRRPRATAGRGRRSPRRRSGTRSVASAAAPLTAMLRRMPTAASETIRLEPP